MIDRAVDFLAKRLNENLRARFGVSEDLVIASCPVGSDGKVPMDARNRLILFVTSVGQDTTARNSAGKMPAVAGRFGITQAPVHLSIELMLAACHEPVNYSEGLRILSHGIQFFQANPTFSPVNAPDLDAGLSQLSLEISNMGTDVSSQVWSMFGGRYLPSIRYRMRTITIDANALATEIPAITDPRAGLEPVGSRA